MLRPNSIRRSDSSESHPHGHHHDGDWITVRLKEPDGQVEWETRLPLADMTVNQARAGINLLGRFQTAGEDGVAALGKLGLVPDCGTYRDQIFAAALAVPIPQGSMAVYPDVPCMVTLSQMAAIVHRSKRTVEKAKGLPLPDIDGGGGMANFWNWDKIRPWLEERYGILLPGRFPADRIPARPPRSTGDIEAAD